MSTLAESKSPYLTPREMTLKAEEIAVDKSRLSIRKLLLLGILAGAYIALGAVFSSVAVTGMSGVWPYGITRISAGLTFSLGLILVVVGGAELFTGNNLMIIALLHRKITLSALIRNWGWVYLGNLIGSVLIALFVIFSRMYTFANGELGKSILNIANNKTHFTFIQAIALGILCNILVCLAVWLTYSTQSTSGKIIAILFPITAFIAAGFEHSVANMYVLSVGLFLKSIDPTFVSSLNLNLSTLTWGNALINNLLPVTIGNILGGSGFVGLVYYLIYRD
ncbi:MAG: formate/nitrite transporter family protein [Anaerolineaceae bacterium]